MREEIDAGAELVREFDRFQPVKAAFWLKVSDEEFRYLYIASEGVTDGNFGVAYGEVLRLANMLRSPYLDPYRVKVVNARHPLARAATEIHVRFPSPRATLLGGSLFGGISVDDVYIYPSPVPAAAT